MMVFVKYLCFLLLTLCFFSCNNSYSYSEDERAADRVMSKALLKLRQEKDLIPCGTGGRMLNEIQMLALAFNYYKPVNLQGARELLIYAANEFVAEINADEKIRPYLANYPFKQKNVEIRIFVHSPDGSDVKTGDLAIVTLKGNELAYSVKCEKDDMRRYETVHTESYNSALEELAKLNKKSA